MDRILEDADGVATLDGFLFTGIAFEDATDIRPRSELSFRRGLLHGPSRDFYPSGRQIGEDMYVCGALHGMARQWRADGTIATYSEWEFGLCLVSREFDSSRELTSETTLDPASSQYRTLELRRTSNPLSSELWTRIASVERAIWQGPSISDFIVPLMELEVFARRSAENEEILRSEFTFGPSYFEHELVQFMAWRFKWPSLKQSVESALANDTLDLRERATLNHVLRGFDDVFEDAILYIAAAETMGEVLR